MKDSFLLSFFSILSMIFSLYSGEGDGGEGGEDSEKRKRQTRGGKGGVKAKKKAEPVGVSLATAKRGKKKIVTIVMGLGSYGR